MNSSVRIAIILALASGGVGAAEPLKGSRFVTVMKSNTLSGTTEEGNPFNIWFLPGGKVTYQDATGARDEGSWRLDPSEDVCIEWRGEEAGEECFTVLLDEERVLWRSKDVSGEGRLRRGITESFLTE